MKSGSVLLCAFCSFHLLSAARVSVKKGLAEEAPTQAPTDQPPKALDETKLKEFIAETAIGCSGCDKVHGLLIGNLVEGLIKSNKVTNITKDGLKLTVQLTNKVYGQVATRSSVPIMWQVDKTLTAEVTIDGVWREVHLTGLHTDVPAQAYRFYKDIMEGAKNHDAKNYDSVCAGALAASDECNTYLKAEHAAATEWFKAHYKQKMNYMDGSGKIGKVLKSLVSGLNWVLKKSVSYDNWGSIVFSMISSRPKTITALKFDGNTVVAIAEPYAGSSNSAEADEYHMLEKAQILGAQAMKNAPSILSKGIAKAAKSGWGFGMMFGHGDPKVAAAIGSYPKANPGYLVNLFSYCEKGSAAEDPACSGSDVGRIHWTDNVPAEYE